MRGRTFYRYIASGFWAPFGFGLAVFCLLLTFGNVFDKLNFFMKHGADAGAFALHILYQAPYFAVKMTPLATLLAALFAIGGMVGRGEWKAGMAGGWRPFDMIKPLLVCSLLAACAQFAVQETISPQLFMRAEKIFEGEMKAKSDWQKVVKFNVAFAAGPETLVTAYLFDGKQKRMDRAVLSEYRQGKLYREVNAGHAFWDGKNRNWVFMNAVEVRYRNGRAPALVRHDSLSSAVSVPPEDLVIERLVPDGISMAQLLRRMRRLGEVGAPAVAEHTLFWVKLAAPLANPVMVLIGAAMALLIRGGNRFLSFGYAVGTGFFFWAVIILGHEAGNTELLPPAAAGLLPVLVFGAASVWGMRRARGF